MAAEVTADDYLGTDRAIFGIDGLWCPSCAAAVEKVILKVPGIEQAQVSYASASAALVWGPGVDLAEVSRRIARLGYAMRPLDRSTDTDERIGAEMQRFGIRLAIAIVFGMWTMLIAIVTYVEPSGLSDPALARGLALASTATALPVICYSAIPLLLSGWRTLRAGAPGMDTLVSLGVVAATGASLLSLSLGRVEIWFDTAVMLVILLLVARLVEMATLRHSIRAIAAVEAALPDHAVLVAGGKRLEVLASEIEAGDIVRVAPGDRVTLDGWIREGASSFDTSSLTGETAPRAIGQGAFVEAGFVNLACRVDIEVTNAVGNRRIDRLGASVDAMLHSRPELHALADRIAGWIVPGALVLVAATVLIWSAAGLPPVDIALRALSVLVIACPCAISLAAPVSHLAAVSSAARRNVLLRRQSATEELGAVRTLVFDKTGTLTFGRPVVTGVRPEPGVSETELLALAACAEGDVRHPIADALRAASTETKEATSVVRHADGVSATIDNSEVLLGSARFLSRHGVPVTAAETFATGTEVFVARDRQLLGLLTLEDALRPEAADILSEIRSMGVRCLMATGDTVSAARAVARTVDLSRDAVHAELSPEDKIALVASLEGPVGFVGDGLNDTGAIVAADVGIAADAANPASVAVADIVISRGGLVRVRDALLISRRARRILRQNLGFATVYNIAALVLAFEGAVPPVAAALAMTASSLTVIANASRLARG